jgi:DNA-binding NarL/FixJ family response regulator
MPKHVLIADDSDTIRKSLRAYLDSETELQVCGEAVDGLDAIEKTRLLSPDLIILDVSMPRMSGMEAAPIIRSMNDTVAIILYTIHAEAISASAAAAAGITVVVSKTANISELSRHVQSILFHVP